MAARRKKPVVVEDPPEPEPDLPDTPDAEEYTDPTPEWDDEENVASEEGEASRVLGKFNATDKGVAGATELTADERVLLTKFRVLSDAFPERTYKLGLDTFPEWFETYGLSLNRGSRKETTQILQGQLNLAPQQENGGMPSNKGPNRW